jgi:hypothetical protein
VEDLTHWRFASLKATKWFNPPLRRWLRIICTTTLV